MIANKLFDLNLSVESMLRYCVAIEGHPDNASASLCGGFVVCCCQDAAGDDKFEGLLAFSYFSLCEFTITRCAASVSTKVALES